MRVFQKIKKQFRSIIAMVFVALVSQAHSDNSISALKSGDLLTQKGENGKWHVVRVLEIDRWPDGTRTAHCLTYEDTNERVKLKDIDSLKVRVLHSPIDENSFLSNWHLLGNREVTKNESAGFFEHLKTTDFPRYTKVSGIDIKALVKNANEHYGLANTLAEKGDRAGAIREYTSAINLFPLFYEAIDNRAFTYMELKDYKSALQDFEGSLKVNPNGVSAYFSKGECLLRLGQISEAREIFSSGIAKFPDKKEMFSKYLEIAKKAE